jgi:hypothetical protein
MEGMNRQWEKCNQNYKMGKLGVASQLDGQFTSLDPSVSTSYLCLTTREVSMSAKTHIF